MKKAAAGAAGLSLARTAGPVLGALGANDRIVVASIGVGGQGMAHLHSLLQMKDVEVAAVCDVDQSRLDRAAQAANTKNAFKDFRKVLDMKEVDAVFVVTPDHWHVIPSIRACEAGKDVFVEKPLGHNIREGRALVEAARRYNRIIQVGTQQRSTPHWMHAVERIRAGEIGKVNLVHVWNVWTTKEMFGNIGRAPDEDNPPPGVDYDMWLGPAPARKFNRLRFHGSWYFFWDYAGGMVSDWGVHLFDVVLWAMGPEIRSVAAIGGRHVHDDARETPDTAAVVFECPGYTMYYTMRHGNGWQPHGQMDHGIEFFGQDRTLQINRAGFQIYSDAHRDTRKPVYEEKGQTGLVEHERNFLECCRSRKRPNADAETGHLGAVVGHLANISYRVGRRIRWDSKNETIPDDPEASALLGREYRAPWHL